MGGFFFAENSFPLLLFRVFGSQNFRVRSYIRTSVRRLGMRLASRRLDAGGTKGACAHGFEPVK